MRALGALLLLAGLARGETAEEAAAAVRAELAAQRYESALRAAQAALARFPGDRVLDYERAQAVRGIARSLQRDHGYGAALEYLETRLDHALLAQAYAETCLWAGEEERGLRHLWASPVPPLERVAAELKLLHFLYRYEEAARRASALGWTEAEEWARTEAALRARLEERARRGARVAAGAAAALLLAVVVLARFAPAPRP